MVRTYVVVRHSGQNWYWGILKRRLLGVQLARPQTSGQRGEKKCRPYLTMATLFTHWTILMAYNVAIKSSETAIRECLHRSKAFMRASVLTGLKWQHLFVKVTLFSASRYKACRTCLEDRHISVREDCYLG